MDGATRSWKAYFGAASGDDDDSASGCGEA